MKITKEGNMEAAKAYEERKYIVKFVCDACGCEFQYDRREADFKKNVRIISPRNETLISADCPCCGNKRVEAI